MIEKVQVTRRQSTNDPEDKTYATFEEACDVEFKAWLQTFLREESDLNIFDATAVSNILVEQFTRINNFYKTLEQPK